MLYGLKEKRVEESAAGMGMLLFEQNTVRVINPIWINWGERAVGKMATMWERVPSQNVVGTHREFLRLCHVKGRMEIVEGGIRATGGGEKALTMGSQ